MTRTEPVIIEAALNGATRPATNPHVPRSPDAIAACAIACLERGAAIVHHHHDDPNIGGPARHDPEPYAQVWRQVLAARPDALVHPTVRGMGAPVEDRYAHLDALYELGLLTMASADPGVVSIGPAIYGNSEADADYMFAWCRARDLPVHVSVFEPGWLRTIRRRQEDGTLPGRTKVQIYFGDRVPFGLPPTETALDAYLELLDGSGLLWMVGVMGGDVVASGIAELAIRRGGHVRVGLEDFRGPTTPPNEDLVREVVALVGALGAEVASCDEARELLERSGRDPRG